MRWSLLEKIVWRLFLVSLVLLGVFYFQKGRLPEVHGISSEAVDGPTQTELGASEVIEVSHGGFKYKIIPKYQYEMSGLVVSQHDSRSWYDLYHKNDPYNTKDLCLMWGDNLASGVYKKMKYAHGDWTCWFSFKRGVESSWYGEFSMSEASNNHLLPSSEEIGDTIRSVSVGDQVRMSGYLVDYTVSAAEGQALTRSTSTVRTDVGNGACEVVYVTDIEVIARGNSFYNSAYQVTKYVSLIVLGLAVLMIFTVSPVEKRRYY
ncbi:MAG: hypothetical protein BWY68_00571 [bacterium ADurb.Bin400]|nr:MAG: hypothetical protein BWY68_00571 [bacterium ADurb.Bin400]